MSLAERIRDQITAYIVGEISLQSLSQWISSVGWEAEDINEPEVKMLFSEVEALVYDHVHSSRPEDSLKEALWALVDNTVVVSFIRPEKKTSTQFVDVTQPSDFLVDARPVMARERTVLCPITRRSNTSPLHRLA